MRGYPGRELIEPAPEDTSEGGVEDAITRARRKMIRPDYP